MYLVTWRRINERIREGENINENWESRWIDSFGENILNWEE